MYKCEECKSEIFTEEGQKLFLGIRDHVKELVDSSGAFRLGHAAILPKGVGCADSWTMIACVDRMVELGEIREIKYGECAGQNRIFVGVNS